MCCTFDPQDPKSEHNQSGSQTEVPTPESPAVPLDLSIKKRLPSVDDDCISVKSEPLSPMDICTTTSSSHTNQTSVPMFLDEPTIAIEPKTQWHYRSMKDLMKNHIPLISGEGPQRTPLQVKILQRYNEKVYLAVTVVTLNKEPHALKVIVPSKTKADDQTKLRKNDLECLIFNECESTDTFDSKDRIVYMEITDRDYSRKLKDVRVHMFNLYQNQTITKDLIEEKQLRKCQLAFWFCIRRNDNYLPISNRSHSSTIEEKPSNVRSNALPTTINPSNDEYYDNEDTGADYENDDPNSSSEK